RNIDTMIAIGSPFLGAPKSARGVLQGYHLEFGYIIPPNRSTMQVNGRVADLEKTYRSLTILSFVDPQLSAKVARQSPAVHQMLPNAEFQAVYSRRSATNAKSLLTQKTAVEYLKIVRAPNPRLFDAAQRWRSDVFNGNDFGVRHLLIGAVCSPETSVVHHQEMEFALKQDVSLDSFLAVSRRTLWSAVQGVWLDEHIATERNWRWGDDVTPLLSATLGSCAMFGDKIDPRPARKHFGPNTHVSAVQLQEEMTHPNEMEDEMIRRQITQAISQVR
ncbi:hypothetical protein OAH18_02100, partial [bacterium]|nr:hypothetical protein [bacterium]